VGLGKRCRLCPSRWLPSTVCTCPTPLHRSASATTLASVSCDVADDRLCSSINNSTHRQSTSIAIFRQFYRQPRTNIVICTNVAVVDNTATGTNSIVLRLNELLTGRQGLSMSTIPNVGIVLKLYLTLPVTSCEGER